MIRFIFLATTGLLGACHTSSNEHAERLKEPTVEERKVTKATVYETDHLVIHRLSEHVYQHVSYLNTQDFGRVQCNGMLVVNDQEAIIFDTPADDESTEELVYLVTNTLDATIKAVIPTHFHGDCVGGLGTSTRFGIPAYASTLTIELLREANVESARLLTPFDSILSLSVGGKEVIARYFGEGHTRDNIVGYVPVDSAVFGGCLIKEMNAGKGNLEDANVKEWSETVRRIVRTYPDAKVVIPGHGEPGGTELFDYTIRLFDIRSLTDK